MTERLLIKGGYVLSMDPKIGELERGDVLVVDGRIAEVGTDLEAGTRRRSTRAATW